MALTPNRLYELPIKTDLETSFDKVVAALGAIDGDVAAAFAALALRATLDSPAFAGEPTAPTQEPGDNSALLATTAFVAAAVLSFSPPVVNAESLIGTINDARLSFQVASFMRTVLTKNSGAEARTTLDVFSKAEVNAAVAALVAAAPGTLDTLNELAAALGDDPNFATTMTTLLAGKATKADGTQAIARAGVEAIQRTWRATDLRDAARAAGRGPDAILEDQKLSGTGGGSASIGVWNPRTLNTKVKDAFSTISLAANRFTPSVAGWVEWDAPGYSIDNHKTRLRNITAGTTVGAGSSEYTNKGNRAASRSVGGAPVVAGNAYELQHYCTDFLGGSDFGSPVGSGDIEVYTRVLFWGAQ
ncbi:hypothetical protein EOB36_18125 [Mesorhizobium sp. M6A.T.Cr.TU.017.01.1.1]|uniref:hypothetical protein n=1 Tax=Mesorhizobium sp. M6A.T.Cr.TU.017.01.1.1 TaxID=2496774 RepID=UPI000FD4C50A|nr:hypothetical protein [Mesorhizobium sp. M6A.T.Cr.TU.017.01.1.1]RUV00064.1 hypothetical protein EOB36_18125 [Mesorhizobium sp. M6A.T.Cr.TU.017.01.1.1]